MRIRKKWDDEDGREKKMRGMKGKRERSGKKD